MESIKSIKWSVEHNDLLGCLNNFALFISTQVIKEDVDDEELSYEHSELGYVLIVKDLNEGRKGCCSFLSLESTMFFINHYLVMCNNLNDVKKLYNSFCLSQEVIDNKGYTS